VSLTFVLITRRFRNDRSRTMQVYIVQAGTKGQPGSDEFLRGFDLSSGKCTHLNFGTQAQLSSRVALVLDFWDCAAICD